MSTLRPVDENLWEIERPLKVPGLRLNHRMTVARLRNGDLWIHSPVEFDPALGQSLAALGPVRHLVAPNCYHDLYWPAWMKHYPDACFYCPQGFPEEHRDWQYGYLLTPDSVESWSDELPKLFVAGMPRINEYVFLHRASRTLIVADLVFNLDVPSQNVVGKLFLKLNGIYGRVGCSNYFRSFIRSQAEFKASMTKLLELDFDRLLMGHGAIIAPGGKEELERALAWQH